MIAACGLDCTECDIFQAADNPEIAQRIVDWFARERGIEVKPEDVHCEGCKDDRAKHWSADCWILEYCVDDKGLESCYECADLPCQRMNEWAKGSERYSDALERLKGMRMR
jgi:hypothetical protein